MFDRVPTQNTGKPLVFVSHTWSAKLMELLSMLKKHFKVMTSKDEAAGVLLWLVRDGDVVKPQSRVVQDCIDEIASMS